ncbi:unnamed protein product, partial [Cuscuta epithymum]
MSQFSSLDVSSQMVHRSSIVAKFILWDQSCEMSPFLPRSTLQIKLHSMHHAPIHLQPVLLKLLFRPTTCIAEL